MNLRHLDEYHHLHRVYVPRILRLQPELGSMFADAMDLPSLTNWRLTCKSNYRQATSSFRRSLSTRLQRFVPYPHAFIGIITKHHAVIGGEFALSFILRDDSYVAASLEVFASDFEFGTLCEVILADPPIQSRIERHEYIGHSLFYALRRLVSQTLHIKMTNGSSIYIHHSYTPSPAAPVTRSPCTALSNFVTGYGFGCSHPRLTLHRRALLADQELELLTPFDSAILERLKTSRFSLEVSPSAWPEFRRAFALSHADVQTGITSDQDQQTADNADTDTEDASSADECWRHMYVCPSQGRFFGDKGSFVEYFDPLGGDEAHCIQNNIAPFGSMVVWRVMSTFDCDEGCDLYDDVLEEGVTSIPVLFRKDPYEAIRELVWDRKSRFPSPRRSHNRRRANSV